VTFVGFVYFVRFVRFVTPFAAIQHTPSQYSSSLRTAGTSLCRGM
jgi:hypothetical protein